MGESQSRCRATNGDVGLSVIGNVPQMHIVVEGMGYAINIRDAMPMIQKLSQ
ncbi:MAG: hypothetical protein HW414_548 [Dehalococcoidia bacterium]|nr:hypothetical protein [Dehalococcoidia bacterium]